jgi:sigma-E factor negative regulatory protein RseA
MAKSTKADGETAGGVMKENLSAWMDGELGGKAAEALMSELRQGGEARAAWRTYHLAGDAMRDTRVLSDGFSERFARRLADEPTVLAPRRIGVQRPWMAMPAAMAAGLAAIALVGWLAFAPQQPGQPVPVAKAPAPAVRAQSGPPRIPLPTATPDYLLAHQGFSPRLSLEGMAPYARTVSAEATEAHR